MILFFYTHSSSQSTYRGGEILHKYSTMATIWLHFLKQNKNCSQEFVQSTHRVHANYCYSNKYVELCSVVTEVYLANNSIFWLQFYQKLATIIKFWLQLSLPWLQLNNSSANENHFQSSLLFKKQLCEQGG